VNRIVLLALAVLVTAGCGQSQETAASAESAAARAPAGQAPESSAAEPAAAETTAAQTAAAPAEPAESGAASTVAAAPGTTQLALADLSSVEAAGFVEGVHYQRMSPTQPTSSSPDQVEVAEFFMHSCIHCYNLEPYVQAWLEDKPAHINFVRVPTTWDAYRQLHARAYYAAEALGIAEEIHMPFFREIHDSGNYLDSPEKLATFFGRFGVSSNEFESLLNSFAVVTRVNRADELGTRYRIQATPTIVVNGKYRTGVDQAGSPDKLFELIEVLAAAELGR